MTLSKELVKKMGVEDARRHLMSIEVDDCVVKSIHHAFGVDYLDAHHFCELKLNRVTRKGTYTGIYLPKVKQAFGRKIGMLGKKIHSRTDFRELTRPIKTKIEKYSHAKSKWVMKRVVKQVPYKVKEFVKAHNEGTYLVVVKGHMFALVEGEIIGNWDDGKRLTKKVESAYKIK